MARETPSALARIASSHFPAHPRANLRSVEASQREEARQDTQTRYQELHSRIGKSLWDGVAATRLDRDRQNIEKSLHWKTEMMHLGTAIAKR